MNAASQQPDNGDTIPVLIVGGGLVGLSTSLFLSWHGMSSLLIERHPSTAIHPRALGWTPRTMELFRSVGIEEAIRKIEPPLPEGSSVPLVESLVGETFDNLQEDIGAYLSDASSPVLGSGTAQDILEPILRMRAEQLGGELRFGTELVDFVQDETGITATIRERESSSTRTVRAQYLVAADGSQSKIRQQLGIGQHGTADMFHAISIIFEADLMKLFLQRHAIMCFLSNDTIAVGSMVPYPGSAARRDLFRLDVGYDPDEEMLDDYPEARCLQLIRAAVGIPDLPVQQIKAVLTWDMNALVADRFQGGRVFLVGDAARTQPPSGALGGNTGVVEAHNLAWKLAAVLRGEAGDALLDTYDAERRPIADYTVEQTALLSQQRQTEGSAGITVDAIMVNTGYRYTAGAFMWEAGTEQLPLVQPPDRWHGLPGTHAPHLVLERQGQSISTLDLFGSHIVLLVGPEGEYWKEAVRAAQEALHLPLDCYQIGGTAGEISDVHHTFCDAYGIGASGAALVRPDGSIAWRSLAAEKNEHEAQSALTQALSTLLFRL